MGLSFTHRVAVPIGSHKKLGKDFVLVVDWFLINLFFILNYFFTVFASGIKSNIKTLFSYISNEKHFKITQYHISRYFIIIINVDVRLNLCAS
jgi:hypothetical protein